MTKKHNKYLTVISNIIYMKAISTLKKSKSNKYVKNNYK